MERNFPVSRELVFDFVTRTEHLVKWWGPKDTTLRDHNLDLSQLGKWWFVLEDPMGGKHRVTGEVLDVSPPDYVEFTLYFPSPIEEYTIDSTVRFELTPNGDGGTIFRLIQSGLTDEQMIKASSQGWVSTLDRLEELLQTTS